MMMLDVDFPTAQEIGLTPGGPSTGPPPQQQQQALQQPQQQAAPHDLYGGHLQAQHDPYGMNGNTGASGMNSGSPFVQPQGAPPNSYHNGGGGNVAYVHPSHHGNGPPPPQHSNPNLAMGPNPNDPYGQRLPPPPVQSAPNMFHNGALPQQQRPQVPPYQQQQQQHQPHPQQPQGVPPSNMQQGRSPQAAGAGGGAGGGGGGGGGMNQTPDQTPREMTEAKRQQLQVKFFELRFCAFFVV